MQKLIMITILSLFCSAASADEITTTSTSSVTDTNANPTVIDNNSNTTTKTTISKTTTTTVDTDAAIVAAIYRAYAKSAALIGTALSVVSENGVVTIDGNVTAQSQADAAVSIAKNTPGVQFVQSKIIVTTNDATSQPMPPAKNY